MWDDGMRYYEGLMGKFVSHKCIECNKPLIRVKKRGKLVWTVNETGLIKEKNVFNELLFLSK